MRAVNQDMGLESLRWLRSLILMRVRRRDDRRWALRGGMISPGKSKWSGASSLCIASVSDEMRYMLFDCCQKANLSTNSDW